MKKQNFKIVKSVSLNTFELLELFIIDSKNFILKLLFEVNVLYAKNPVR